MISYAQNLEDVVLNRVFQNKPDGFYIDVGAHDPIELSVTKHFYDLGWHGVNIEPVPASYEKFKKERPDDINLNLALGSRHDFNTIYEIEDHSELTTLEKDIAESTGKLVDAKIKSYKIEIRTLTEVCEQYCNGFIDFIKIDVEGAEKGVIGGANWDKFRPTMLVVEATIPNSGSIQDWDRWDENDAWHEWEPLLFEAEYILAYYDGLNRYYLRKEDEHLKNRFAIPVTWLQDQFSLYRDVRETWRLDAENKHLEMEKGDLARQFDALIKDRSELLKERDQLLNKETKLVSKNETLDAARVQLVKEKSELLKDRDQLLSKKTKLVSKNETLDAARVQLAKEKSELLKDRDQLLSKKTKLVSKNETLDAARVQLVKEKSELLKERDQLLSKEAKLASENETLDAARVQLVKENAELANQFDSLATQHSELLKVRDQLLSKNTELVSKNVMLYAARVQLVKENAELANQFDSLATQHSELLKVRDQLLSKNTELVSKNETLKTTQSRLMQENSNHNILTAELQGELRNKHHEFDILRATLEDEHFIRQRNPVQRLIELLKPLFPIKEAQDVQTDDATAGCIQPLSDADRVKGSKSFPEADGKGRKNIKPEKIKVIEQGSDSGIEKTGIEVKKPPCEKLVSTEDNAAKYTHPMLLSNWEKVVSVVRKEIERAGLVCIPELELEFNSGRELPISEWVAISHVPARLPVWMTETKAYKPSVKALFASRTWNAAKRHCKGIFTFSQDHADILNVKAGVKTTALRIPQPEVRKRWSWEAFMANQEKEIIQVGWWLMRMHGIYLLPDSGYKKLWIRSPEQQMDIVFTAERIHLKERFMFFNHMDNAISVLNNLPSQDYEERLSANIAFAHYYDASAPDFLMQCIARHTPILINPLPAVREYLGDDYPLYYYFYKDAVKKASNYDLLHKAHEYLAVLSKKMDVNPEGFAIQTRNALEEN